MSAILGTSFRTYSPSARSDAAISFSAEFLAPRARALPRRGVPPATTYRSMGAPIVSGTQGARGSRRKRNLHAQHLVQRLLARQLPLRLFVLHVRLDPPLEVVDTIGDGLL